MRALGAAAVHVLVVIGLVLLTLLLLLYTAERDTWYHPEYPNGDDSGYLVVSVAATLFVAAPVIVLTYAVALTVSHLVQRRWAQRS